MPEADNSKTFDRALWLMAFFAVITAVLAAVAAFGSDGDTAQAADVEQISAAIELNEFAITGDLTVDPGNLTITLTNSGTMIHNLVFEDGHALGRRGPRRDRHAGSRRAHSRHLCRLL